MSGDFLTRVTVAAATLSYAGAEWLRFRRPAAWHAARLAWTAAAMLTLAHVAAAFQFHHAWSHRAALSSTASQTAALTGLEWGGGLYINYAFLLLWATDAAYWWIDPPGYASMPPALVTARAFVFFFMFFNGAVVFAHGPTQLLGIACTSVAVWAWYVRSQDLRPTPR